METIFVSYRRDDRPDAVGRICDRLVQRFGDERVFRDVDDIELGENFLQRLTEALEHTVFVLVAIGPDWLNLAGADGRRRLDSEDDIVRLEVRKALELRKRVIPMLVGGATMPPSRELPGDLRPLVHQNGIAIRRDPDFERDAEALMAALEPKTPDAPPPVPDRKLMPSAFSTGYVARNMAIGSGWVWAATIALLGLAGGPAAAVVGLLCGLLVGWAGGGLAGWVAGWMVRRAAPSLVARELRRMGWQWALGTVVGGLLVVAIGAMVLSGWEPSTQAPSGPVSFEDAVGQLMEDIIVGCFELLGLLLLFALLIPVGLLLGAGLVAAFLARRLRLRAEQMSRKRAWAVALVWTVIGVMTGLGAPALMGWVLSALGL